MTRQEQRIILALRALSRAVSALDLAIDYNHSEELHPSVLAAISESEALFDWLAQFLTEAEL